MFREAVNFTAAQTKFIPRLIVDEGRGQNQLDTRNSSSYTPTA